MPELGFRSGHRARDISPDSVIFSLFSSASASVDRCSFASDVPDQDSVSSAVSPHLAGHELSQVLRGPDPDPNKSLTVHKNSICLSTKEKAKVQILDSSEAETTEDENVALDSARNSFSQAFKECQGRRLRSEVLLKKANHRRPASLDLNIHVGNANAVSSTSPRFGVMKKPSAVARRAGTFPSPGTPNYRHSSVGIHKGWSSERVPLHPNAMRRTVSTGLLPLNYGRTLPSKWEDAERWIVSPVSGNGTTRISHQQPQRRPKSKSGPLGLPGVAYYQMFSPATSMFEGCHAEKLTANTRYSAGVMAMDGLSVQFGGCEGTGNFLTGTEPCMARSISIHGCSEIISQQSLPGHHDVKYDVTEDGANNISRAVSRRDMATQMSPGSSNHSSPRRDSSFSLATPAILTIVELQSLHSFKPKMRDVPVDERVTLTRWSKKNRGKNPGRGSRNSVGWKRRAVNYRPASWEVSTETSKSISKIQREEAKITAWENLQKAKAEAAIRKLEMKLEKKRSSSMDKIVNKLKYAQKKAQEMRSSMMANPRPSERALSFRRAKPVGSLSGCFSCHAF